MANAESAAVAVVDVGTARTKVLIRRLSGGDQCDESLVIDESIAKAFDVGGAREASACVREVLTQALERLRSRGVGRFCALGAHIFRDGELGAELSRAAEETVQYFSVVSPSQEAGLFYRSLVLEGFPDGFVAADIGGGSVQLVWGSADGQCCSAPVGTFSLESRFQRDKTCALHPDGEEWAAAAVEVRSAFGARVPGEVSASVLVIGSNIMESFFAAAFAAAGLAKTPDCRFSKDDLITLARLIGGVPYQDSYKYFPQAPRFIHGADKLLLVSTVLMDVLSCGVGYGTNGSLSKGVCALLASNPDALKAAGLKVCALG